MDAFAKAGGAEKVIEEMHELEKAHAGAAPKVVTEKEEDLFEDDVEISQEVIDILKEAMAESGSEDGASDESVSGDEGYAIGDVSAEVVDGVFTISLGKLEKADGKVLLPAYMLKYFN